MAFKIIYSLLILGCAFVITSCGSKSDLSLLENDNCKLPCWNQIAPQTTNEDDAISILKDNQHVDQASVKQGQASHRLYPDYISWNFLKDGYGIVSLKENLVVSIELGNVSYAVKDLFNLYKTPEEIVIFPYNGREWRVYLLYPQKGLWLSYIKRDDGNWRIDTSPDDRVTQVFFISPSEYDSALEFIGSPYLKNQNLSLPDVLQPWTGYGKIPIIKGHEK